jgi:hypothetical protein
MTFHCILSFLLPEVVFTLNAININNITNKLWVMNNCWKLSNFQNKVALERKKKSIQEKMKEIRLIHFPN